MGYCQSRKRLPHNQTTTSSANSNPTAYLSLMSLLSTPILAYRFRFTVNARLLDRTHSGGSFCLLRRKINLIKTLVHRALIICSKAKLSEELNFILMTLLKNGYPEDITTSTIKHKVSATLHQAKV